MKVLSVAGYHHTGKTGVVVALLAELKRRGFSVSSVKDIHNEAFTMEKPGSNSWRHWEASQDTVIARGLAETYQIWHRRLTLNEMLARLDTDFVIVEGIRDAALPRIITAESEVQLDELVDETVFAVSGIYSDHHRSYRDLPVLNAERDIAALTDLVVDKVFDVLPLPLEECCTRCGSSCHAMVGEILAGRRQRGECRTDRITSLSIEIDGKPLTIVPYVQDTLRDVIRAFLGNLKGVTSGDVIIRIPDRS